MDVGTIVARAARRHAARIAVEDDRRSLTFGELGDRVRRLAAGLLSLGLRPGDRVLDLQTNAVSYVETDLAFATAGLVRVALNHRLLPEDWTRIAGDCDARAIVYHEDFHAKVGPLADALDFAVVIGGDYESLIARTDPLPRRLGFGPDTLVSLNYSSGTTGKPKGARRTHRNRVASTTNMMADVLGAQRPDDAWVHAGPITHASGLFVLPHVALGVRQIILHRSRRRRSSRRCASAGGPAPSSSPRWSRARSPTTGWTPPSSRTCGGSATRVRRRRPT
ncbi:MAG: AMP-binding protein, partial [Actinomycetota bacterium]